MGGGVLGACVIIVVCSGCPPPPDGAHSVPPAEDAGGTSDVGAMAAPNVGASLGATSEPVGADGVEMEAEGGASFSGTSGSVSSFLPALSCPDAQRLSDEEGGAARFETVESEVRSLEGLEFAARQLRTFGDDLARYKDDLVRSAKEITAASLDVMESFPCAPTWSVAARYRIAWAWFEVCRRFAVLPSVLPEEWVDLEMPSGLTFGDLIGELAPGIRGVVVVGDRTVEQIVRAFLTGVEPASDVVVPGALTFASQLGVANEWSERAKDLFAEVEAAWGDAAAPPD